MDEKIKLIIPLPKQLKIINEFHNWLINEINTRFEEPLKEYHSIVGQIIHLQEKRGRNKKVINY
jgi:hypothetical protein